MTSEYWNKKHVEHYKLAHWMGRPTIFAEQVVEYFPKGGRLLDVGTGQGQDAAYFGSLGYDVSGVDYADAAIQIAQERVKDVDFRVVDVTQGLPFEDESFDVVYSHMALHYFDAATTKKVFADIYRVLKPEGIFATLVNSVDDSEMKEYNYEKIEDDFYKNPAGIAKRYFSVETMGEFTKDLFEPLLLDNEGKTYKDEIFTLIRFVGKKI